MTEMTDSQVEEKIKQELASLMEAEPAPQHAYPGRAHYEPAPSRPDPFNKSPYAELQRILKLAYDQSASGKGAERHAASPVGVRAWHDQPILANARQVGPGGPALQIMKKSQESVTMAGNGNFAGAKAEALGAIVYAAALYKLYEEMERSSNG